MGIDKSKKTDIMKVQNKLFVSTENSRGLKVKIKYSKDALKFLSKLDK